MTPKVSHWGWKRQNTTIELIKQLPQWALAHFALGLVDEARGEAAQVKVEFATAFQCDQSLPAARTRAETDLAKLRNQ
jgi:hypothetical protein